MFVLRLRFAADLAFRHNTTFPSSIIPREWQTENLTRCTLIFTRLGTSFRTSPLTRAGLSFSSCSLQTTRGLGTTEAKKDNTADERLVSLWGGDAAE